MKSKDDENAINAQWTPHCGGWRLYQFMSWIFLTYEPSWKMQSL